MAKQLCYLIGDVFKRGKDKAQRGDRRKRLEGRKVRTWRQTVEREMRVEMVKEWRAGEESREDGVEEDIKKVKVWECLRVEAGVGDREGMKKQVKEEKGQ